MAIEISEPVKAKVITNYVAGTSKSQIARDLGISRPTVIKIIAEAQIDNYVETAKQDALQLIPRSIEIIEESLGSEQTADIKLRAANMILKGIGVLSDKLEHSGELSLVIDMPGPERERT